MIAHYGDLFVSKYGEEDKGIWRHVLSAATEDDLYHGVYRLFQSSTDYSTFPPSPLEFRDLCYDIDKENKMSHEDKFPKIPLWLGVDMTDLEQRKRLLTPVNREAGEKAINEIYKILGKPRKQHER